MEAKLGSISADLEEARAKIVVLTEEKEKGINAYMLTPDFVELMKEHDAQRRPEVYEEGWDAAVEAITEAHPETLLVDSFPCPLALPNTGATSEDSDEPLREDERILATFDSPTEDRGQKRKAASTSEEGSSSTGSESGSESEGEPAAKKQRAEETSSGSSSSEPSKAS